jgi:bifunctional lysine-specific demethylase and histidyl-hydroxylase NO66
MDERVSRAVDPDRPALRRCIAVGPDEFATAYWSRRPLFTPAADLPADFSDLFSLDAADELVSRRGLRSPFLRMARNGNVLDPAAYTRGGGAGAEIADQAAGDKVSALFRDGATLVLQALHRTWPALGDFGRGITADLGHPIQINAYLTPAQSTGFSAHYDVHDVFVLQVAGEKRWVIHEPVRPHPLRTDDWGHYRAQVQVAAAGTPALDTVLRPGDALYLPRGWLHAAEALGDVSVHLTVGIQPVTRYALVEALTGLAADVPELRASLPAGVDVGDPAAIAAELSTVVTVLGDWLATADPADVAARLRRRLVTAAPPEPVRPLAQAAAESTVDVHTRVALRAGLAARVDADGDSIHLRLPDRRLTLPAYTEPAVKAMLTGRPTAVGDLPGLDAADQCTLARRLLHEAVIVPR